MVNLGYVRKRNRKRAAIIVSGVTACLVACFVIISYLGQKVGSFTVKLAQSKVELALSKTYDFEDYTTYLHVDNLPTFELNTNDSLLDHDKLDNEETDYEDGLIRDGKTGEPIALYYFKYTFYVKNVGSATAEYDFNIKILDNQRPSNVTYGYDDLLRVRLYENDGASDEHEFNTYAKRIRNGEAVYQDEDGNYIYDKLISGEPGTDSFKGFATSFVNESVVVSNSSGKFDIGQITRYTAVIWLEGDDPMATGAVPKGGSMRLGIEINAHEYKNKN